MTFEIPKITVAPTVAIAAEGGTPSETDQNAAFVSVDVKKYIGQQTFSLELLDRSSPAFFAELVRQMEFAYAKATDERVATILATLGIILAALYVLLAVQRAIHGETPASSAGISDLNLREKIAIAPVIAILVLLGFYPKPALEVINPTTQTIMTNVGVSDPIAKVVK
jgi:HK97 family phage major capsid protein